MRKLNCIVLIDDNKDDNFFHERVIRKSNAAEVVITKESAMDGLTYLTSAHDEKNPLPDLILLDINMPGMNGWEFLSEYNSIDENFKSKAIVVMLTTSDNTDDQQKTLLSKVASDFRTKPLTKQMLEDIIRKFF